MTETTPTTYVIPMPMPHPREPRAHYQITRPNLVRLIASVELNYLYAEEDKECRIGDNGYFSDDTIRSYIAGISTRGEAAPALSQCSDQELVEYWSTGCYAKLEALRKADYFINDAWTMDYVPKAEVEARLAQQQRDTLMIEGMSDGETIEIGRDALIQRLVALRIDMAIRPITDMQADTHAGYAEILRGGFKGFEHSGADELLETWSGDRKEFYSRIMDGYPLRIDQADPEWEDLINFDMDADDNETGVDTTNTPLY
jgi:hypothetical protein